MRSRTSPPLLSVYRFRAPGKEGQGDQTIPALRFKKKKACSGQPGRLLYL